MQRKQIMPQVFLNTISADKFKCSRVTVNFIMPSVRETATAMAILPAILSRGYADCPDMKQLGIKLARLYGAGFSADSGIQGANRVISFSVTGIKDEFALDGEGLTQEYLDILFGSIFEPVLLDGVFKKDIIEIEKQKLKEEMESEINDKRSYCLKQARRKFYKNHPAGIEKFGYVDEVDGLKADGLYTLYKQVLQMAEIEIMVIGADVALVEKRLFEQLQKIERNPKSKIQNTAMPKAKPEEFKEPVDAVQGKLCLVFTADKILPSEDLSKMRVAIALFGGLPTSRLFTNVREKQSLCYYCAAGFAQITSVLTVDSGVEHKNAEKTKKAVLKELDDLIKGDITDEEIENARRALVNSVNAVGDSLAGLEGWYFGEISRGTAFDPIDVRKQLEVVTKQDIKDMLQKFSLSVVYTLTQGDK